MPIHIAQTATPTTTASQLSAQRISATNGRISRPARPPPRFSGDRTSRRRFRQKTSDSNPDYRMLWLAPGRAVRDIAGPVVSSSRNDLLRPGSDRSHYRLFLVPFRRLRYGRRDGAARRPAELFRRPHRDDLFLHHSAVRQRLACRAMAPLRALADFRLVSAGRRDRVRVHVDDCLCSGQGDGLPVPRCDAIRCGGFAGLVAPEHRMAGRPVLHRRGDDDHGDYLAGVGGLFLDIFFQKSMLDRKTTNATKAVTQSFSHIVRALYFGSLSGVGDLPIWATGPAIVLAIAGTSLAPFVHRAHDRSRLSAVDARDHFRHQLRLSCPRTRRVLARLRPRVRVFRLLARPDDARDP